MAETVHVGPTDEVPEGEMRAYDVGGRQLTVANVDGSFFAFDDECTHQQCSLAEGDLEDDRVTCMCHGSQFDVTTGEVMNPPATEPVDTYDVSVEDGDLVVTVE